ncbi:beta-alanine-activating enzyme beta-propeller domain-containing protein [Halosimplex marinum]|uniref:beta-alanine-activating enzyme beta-propeller domain-containing protein n=1 Tax=Halosimplex marinum TaxID=3396620 RepID=UPI003F56BF08
MYRSATRRQVLRKVGTALISGAALPEVSDIAVSQQAREEWRQFGYDDVNTGYAIGNSGPVEDVSREWVYDAGGRTNTNPTGAPIVIGDSILIGTHVSLDVLSQSDGSYAGSIELNGGGPNGSPALDSGAVYVHGGNIVSALDASDGTEQWTYQTDDYSGSSPTVKNGTVYVGSGDNNVYALNAADGTEQWTHQTDGRVDTTPAVANSTVYVGSEDNSVYALDSSDGTEKWTYQTEDLVESSPAVVDGTVYVGSFDSSIYALDASNGTEEWTSELGGPVFSSPAIADGSVYVAGGSTVHAFDANNGRERWLYETDGGVHSPPAVVDDTVYVGCWDNTIYALNVVDGTEQWTHEIDEAVHSGPVVADGTVYVEDGERKIHAITGQGPTPTPSPTQTRSPTPTRRPSPTPSQTPTPSPKPANAALDTPSPTSSSTTTDEGGFPMVALGSVAVLFGGLGGGWLLRRDGDDSSVSAANSEGNDASVSQATTSTPEVTQGTADPFAEGQINVRETIEAATDRGDGFRNEADRASESGDYERAISAYDDALDAYEEGLDEIRESGLGTESEFDTESIYRRLAAVERDRQTVTRQFVREEIESVRNRLDQLAETVQGSHRDNADRAALERVRDDLESLNERISSLEETANHYEFEEICADIGRLAERREDLLRTVTDRLGRQQGPPDRIPGAPAVAVSYEDVTNEVSIGSGGNADVTRATLPTPDGDVTLAIKRPRMNGTLHARYVERLLAEAETWSKLDGHDHIVSVVDYGSDPFPWIAMEYMDGGDLKARSDEMEYAQKLWTAIAVTRGVRHAHQRGIAHLDLKPSNILLREVDGAWDVPKVADWGLSKHLLEHSQSVDGMSPHYAAPEQFDDGYGPTDNLTDVYQLGAVFYDLFTGRPPFEGRPTKVMRAVLDDEPTPPSELVDVPEALDDTLLTALAKSRDDRYEDLLYFRDELRDLFENDP